MDTDFNILLTVRQEYIIRLTDNDGNTCTVRMCNGYANTQRFIADALQRGCIVEVKAKFVPDTTNSLEDPLERAEYEAWKKGQGK